MALFNITNVKGNDNEIQQEVNHGDGCTWKLWQIIVGIATIVGAIATVLALIFQN